MIRGRRGGKTLEYRRGVEDAAMAGQHIHAYAPDGAWCVTWQPGGFFLWARLSRPTP
jgi:hypothetical protein